MYSGCIANQADKYSFSEKKLTSKHQEWPLIWIVFWVLIAFYANKAESQTDDLIPINSEGPPGIEVLKDRESAEATQEYWQDRLSLAEKRKDKKGKHWHLLENAMFPALAVVVVAGWYFGDQIPVLNLVSPEDRAFFLVNAATTIATVYPWVLRDARRWLSEAEGERTQWLPGYAIFWGIQAGIWLAISGTQGNSLVWSQLSGYTFLDLLYQSGDIDDDDDTLLFTMSLVSAVVADVFYLVTYPQNIATHVAHALGHVNGGVMYYLLNRIGRAAKPSDKPRKSSAGDQDYLVPL